MRVCIKRAHCVCVLGRCEWGSSRVERNSFFLRSFKATSSRTPNQTCSLSLCVCMQSELCVRHPQHTHRALLRAKANLNYAQRWSLMLLLLLLVVRRCLFKLLLLAFSLRIPATGACFRRPRAHLHFNSNDCAQRLKLSPWSGGLAAAAAARGESRLEFDLVGAQWDSLKREQASCRVSGWLVER